MILETDIVKWTVEADIRKLYRTQDVNKSIMNLRLLSFKALGKNCINMSGSRSRP